MKSFKLSVLAILSALFLMNFPTKAADPCETVLCLYGKVTGNSGGGECLSPEKAFFDIVKFSHGIFKPWETLDARKSFLGGCPTADPEAVSKILDKFGFSLG